VKNTKIKKPNLFIVGAGKAGTSALYEYLSQHPDIYMSSVKEPNYFGSDLKFCVPRITQKEYRKLFASGEEAVYRGEASVSYLLSSDAAQEIRNYSDNAKIIIMVRNPIEIVQARHAQNLLRGVESIKNFEQALDAETGRRRGECIPECTPVIDWLYYYEWGKLATQIDRYLMAFKREDIFIGVLLVCSFPTHSHTLIID